MKIMVVGPDYFNYTNSVSWAAEQLGHQICECLFENYDKKRSYVDKKMAKWGIYDAEPKYRKQWNEAFRQKVRDFEPELVLVLNGDWIDAKYLSRLRKVGIYLKIWLIDSIRRMPKLWELLPYYHTCHVFEPEDCWLIKERLSIDAAYLPVGYDPRSYMPMPQAEKDVDICFVGGVTAHRLFVLQAVAAYAEQHEKNMIVYGQYWNERHWWKKRRFAEKYGPLHKYVANRQIMPQEVASLYNRSKICLNIHIEEHDGPNPRIFEIAGTNSFQIVDHKPILPMLLAQNEIITYIDIQDLVEKIDYFLEHQHEAEEIAGRCFLKVKQEHNMVCKVRELIDCADRS